MKGCKECKDCKDCPLSSTRWDGTRVAIRGYCPKCEAQNILIRTKRRSKNPRIGSFGREVYDTIEYRRCLGCLTEFKHDEEFIEVKEGE